MLTFSSLQFRYGIGTCLLIAVSFPWFAVAQSFTHVHLRTPNPAATAEWYHTLLGGTLRPSSAGMGSVGQIHGSIAMMLDEEGAEPARLRDHRDAEIRGDGGLELGGRVRGADRHAVYRRRAP